MRDLHPPERGKRYTCRRVEEELDALHCSCGKSKESETHRVVECEPYHGGRDVLQGGKWKVNEDGAKISDSSDCSKKTMATLEDVRGSQTGDQGAYKICIEFGVLHGRNVMSAHVLGVSRGGVGTVLFSKGMRGQCSKDYSKQ